MTAGEAAAAPGAGAEPWRIVRGRPDAAETAAVLAVLSALLGRRAVERPDPPRTEAAGWDRAGGFRRAGTWRER
ncbi:acyl-CoA carboxylase epsilon subunit [Streptomyces sp. NPDC048357]|uniref:acyl-CoA carboxylase epsilon subunit n=1 Tax=Streptomyces sp. NPDC048357 TaxID=3154719 RepID=UPI003438AC83